jgi:hypothetical protein
MNRGGKMAWIIVVIVLWYIFRNWSLKLHLPQPPIRQQKPTPRCSKCGVTYLPLGKPYHLREDLCSRCQPPCEQYEMLKEAIKSRDAKDITPPTKMIEE